MKNPTSSVICGADFSPAAGRAADVACIIAKGLRAPVEMAHVSTNSADPTIDEKLAIEATRVRERGVRVRERLLFGNADEELVKRAKQGSCQLLVIASLGNRSVKRWLLGSVSERTAERARVPTLVVRDSVPFNAWARGERPLKVLVAFNFSETSETALRWVRKLEAIGPCEIMVAHIDCPPEQRRRPGGAGPPESAGDPPDARSALERDLERRVAELLGTRTGFSTLVEPSWTRADLPLVEIARRSSADLVVVGSHQYRSFERLWKTSTTHAVLHGSEMSVAVVPRIKARSRAKPTAPPLRRVLVTTDFSDLANLAIPHACSLLRGGGTVHLVNVIHPEELPGGEYLTGKPDSRFKIRHEKHIRTCENKLRALIPPDASSLGIQTGVEVVEHRDAARGICQAAERFGADAICTATHGRSGLSKVVLGSVAQRVLELGTRPLLLVRPPPES